MKKVEVRVIAKMDVYHRRIMEHACLYAGGNQQGQDEGYNSDRTVRDDVVAISTMQRIYWSPEEQAQHVREQEALRIQALEDDQKYLQELLKKKEEKKKRKAEEREKAKKVQEGKPKPETGRKKRKAEKTVEIEDSEEEEKKEEEEKHDSENEKTDWM